MGTLQSFTPQPECALTLFLLNPSRLLSNLLENQNFKKHYKFQTQTVDMFPFMELLENKSSSGRKKMKIIVEEENLIDIFHFILIFHHQIVIIKKELSIGNNFAKLHKEIKFKDQIDEESKFYSPIEIECFKHCASIQMQDLKIFVENHDDLRDSKDEDKIHVIEPKWMKQEAKNLSSDKIFEDINDIKKKQELQDAIKVRNYKRRSTNKSSNKSYQFNTTQQQIFLHVPHQQPLSQHELLNVNPRVAYILFSHFACPFNPISLIFSHIPQRMTNKVMNLLNFYKASFVRYPSLETFLAAGCNSTKIICGSNELEEIGKKVEAEEYPFDFFQTANAFVTASSSTLDLFQNDSMNVHHPSSATLTVCNEPQDLTIYCFCNESFEHSFTTNSTKLIGILKDKLIEIKFFKNLIELVKQLFKDQHIQMSGDILKEILKQKALLLSNKKLSSNIETGAWCQGENEKVTENNVENEQKSSMSNEVVKNKALHHPTKKESFSRLNGHSNLLAKLSQIPFNRLNKTSSYISGQFSRPSIPNLRAQTKQLTFGQNFKEDRNPLSYINSTVYFFLHQKQNDRYSIQSLPKKIARGLKNMKVKKILELDILVEKIKHQYISIVILSDSPKILQEFFAIVEQKAVQDKIILIKREESDTHQSLVNKVNEARQVGLLKLENFHMFSFISRKIIVMGTKAYLRHIFNTYPYLDVKEFIDITIFKEHRKIREVITRKNEIIVSNKAICEVCNLEYRGLIKAKIIFYESQNQSNQLFPGYDRGECKCTDSKDNLTNSLKLDKLLDMHPCHVPLYPYMNKKIQSCASQISALFTKIKEKKSLPTFESFPNQISEITFLCADSWTIEQITMILVKLFTNRYSNIWLAPWMARKVMYDCVKQCQVIVQFLVSSAISVYKGQISTKSVQIIEQAKEIYKYLRNCFDEMSDIYQLSQALLELFIQNAIFRKAVNYAWRNLLALNKHEYPFECCTLFLVIFLGFRKAAAMKRNDSINNGTFSSFKAFNSVNIPKAEAYPNVSLTVEEEIQSPERRDLLTSIKVNCSFDKNSSFSRQNSNSNSSNSDSFEIPVFRQQKQDEIVEKVSENLKPTPSTKIYLKLINNQKVYDDESLRKFFISKNNAFSYIYTTEFLVFEIIEEKEIDAMISSCVGRNSNFPNSNRGTLFGSRFSISSKKKIGQTKNSSRSSGRKDAKKNSISFSSASQGKSPANKMSSYQQSIYSMFSSFQSNSKSPYKSGPNSPPKTQNDEILEMKTCKNIDILPSTDDSLIICVQNIELLNYNIFTPFYRSSQTKKKQKKTFIIPPFTKLQINNNYSNITTLSNPSTSLITHQLKLSPEHQQRFLEKILETFLVERSEYNGALKGDDKMESETQFQVDSSKLFGMEIRQDGREDDEKEESKQKEVIVIKSALKFNRSGSFKPFEEIKLVDQSFKLPYTDQFFILMNEFKYFSAHYLLISHLPKTNMTNAYHAILLTRKGLYHEADKILLPSNPFKFTVQKYINELRNRMMATHKYSEEVQSQKLNIPKKPKIMKWKVSYASKEEKFFIKDADNPDVAFCYNDDSLDVIYKQIFINFQNKTQIIPQNTKPPENSSIVDQQIQQAQIGTGTFVSTKKPTTRRAKKQPSIADQQIQFLRNSREKKLSDIGLDTSTISGRSRAYKMGRMSRDSILNDMRFFQQIEAKNPMLTGMTSDLNRRSRISHTGSSSFMFGNQNIKKITPLLRASNRISRSPSEKEESSKNNLSNMNVYEEIQEKESSSSQSLEKSSNEACKSRISYKKMTPIHVRTRNRSNFFVEKDLELRRQKSLLKANDQDENQTNSKILVERNAQNSKSSFETDKLIIKNQEDKTQKSEVQSTVQKVMNEDQQELSKQINTHKKLNQQLKGPIMLFKNFEFESELQNDSWETNDRKRVSKEEFLAQELISETLKPVRDSESTLQANKISQDICQSLQVNHANQNDNSENNDAIRSKSIQKLRSIIKKSQVNSLYLKKSVQSPDKPKFQSKERQNKQKCRFTFDLSSESSDEDTIELIMKQTNDVGSVSSEDESNQNLRKLDAKSLSPKSHHRIKSASEATQKLFNFQKKKQEIHIPSQKLEKKDSVIDLRSHSSQLFASDEGQSNDCKELNQKIIQKVENVGEQSSNPNNVMIFSFKKKVPDQINQKMPFPNNQNYKTQSSQFTVLNRVSEESSRLKTTSSEESKVLKEDHQEFLKSHTSFHIWHQMQQTQKNMKSSKKLLKSAKSMVSHLKVMQNQVYSENQNLPETKNEQSDTKMEKNEDLTTRHKQKQRTEKNSFTFMRPSTGAQNKPIYIEGKAQKKEIDPQSEHIIHFHSQLMNNSSMIDLADQVKEIKSYLDQKSILSAVSQHKFKKKKVFQSYPSEQDEKGTEKQSVQDEKTKDKCSIFVKKDNKFDEVNKSTKKQCDFTMRKTVQDYNHQKENYEVDKKLNFSTDKPLQSINEVSNKQSNDSWYENEGEQQKKQSKCMLNFMNQSMSKKHSTLENESEMLLNSRQKQKQTQQQHKVHPQELAYIRQDANLQLKKEKLRRNAEFCEGNEEQKISPGRLNMASLKKLKMNCDIRRKR